MSSRRSFQGLWSARRLGLGDWGGGIGMVNFLEETRDDIKASGNAPDDVVFIGSTDGGFLCTWAEFEGMADFEYDGGEDAAQIASDLRIVFADGSELTRSSEGWVHHAAP